MPEPEERPPRRGRRAHRATSSDGSVGRAAALAAATSSAASALRRNPLLTGAGTLATALAVVAIVFVTQAAAPGACAAGTPRAASRAASVVAAASTGTATWYTLAGLPNCSYPSPPDDGYFVALGPAEYGAAAACGEYLDVTGPDGSVRVKVVDQCPECSAGELDLSKAAFARIADPQRGKVDLTYTRVVNPATPAALTVRVKEGSSQWWLGLLVDQHGNRLTKVQVRTGGSGAWSTAARADYNYWLVEDGAGTGPFAVRVTDDQGHTVTLTGIDLDPGTTQSTGVRLYSGGSSAPGGGSGAGGSSSDGTGSDDATTTTKAAGRTTRTKPTTTTGTRSTTGTTTTAPGATTDPAPTGTPSAAAAPAAEQTC